VLLLLMLHRGIEFFPLRANPEQDKHSLPRRHHPCSANSCKMAPKTKTTKTEENVGYCSFFESLW
jgi:hypothetical protein